MPLTVELARSRSRRRGGLGRRRRRRPTEGVDVDWGPAGQGFEAKKGEVRALPGEGGTTTYVVGLGPADEVDATCSGSRPASLARAAKRHGRWRSTSSVAWPRGSAARRQAIAEGLVLGGYQFSAFKSDPKPGQLSVVVVGHGGKRRRGRHRPGPRLAEAVCWARDLENEPGGSLTPTELAEQAVAAGGGAGFEVDGVGREGDPQAEARRPPRRQPRVGPGAPVPPPRVRRRSRRAPSPWSARGSPSTPAGCR